MRIAVTCVTCCTIAACGGSGSSGLLPPDPVVKAKYDGTGPNSAILARDGYLYGTTITGGDYGFGTVFRVSPDGVETVIHSFSGGTAEGANPVGLIQGSDGNLYGTTQNGGLPACPRPVPFVLRPPGLNFDYNGCGTVFKLSLRGEITVLHFFAGAADGNQPFSSLVEASPGVFFGETNSGGIADAGVIFTVTSAGSERTVYSFNVEKGDGARPVGLALGRDGNLYGTAMIGGQANRGTIFKLTPAGAHTVLYSFQGVAADSAEYPNGPLVQASDGNLYGTTLNGGFPQSGNLAVCEEGCGTIFRITPAGDTKILYSFGDITVGALPTGALIAAGDDSLNGITAYGGNTTVCPQSGCGTVYKLALSGAVSAVYRFDQPVTGTAVQPQFPSSLVRGDNGYLYGTAAGGEFDEGVVFRISPTGEATLLHSFRGQGS